MTYKTFNKLNLYEKEDGWYDKDGWYYESLEAALQTGVLGFCGCGMPEASLNYVYKALKQVDADRGSYNTWSAKNQELFGSNAAEYFMWYFLDTKDLTEHGGSVPGWLTDKGKQMLEALEIYLKII